MSVVRSLEAAVAKLSPEELSEFRKWFQSFDEERWDAQLESDSASGRLDELIGRAVRDFRADRCKDL